VAKGEKKEKKGKEEAKDKKKEKAAAKPEAKELSGGVKIQDHKVGSGPQAKSGDMVSMRYVGKLQNGKVFDSNTSGAPVCQGTRLLLL
jgi:FK506-binding nuclear protein